MLLFIFYCKKYNTKIQELDECKYGELFTSTQLADSIIIALHPKEDVVKMRGSGPN